VIKQIQKQWLVWPTCYQQDNNAIKKTGRFDKVIGLVPQQLCLFKTFYYQCDLVAHRELRECVQNEINQLVEWAATDLHLWIAKRDEQWIVSAWFWERDSLTFSKDITHVIPALAYYLACVSSDHGTFIYQERRIGAQHATSSVSWAVSWLSPQCIEQLYPLSSPLHFRKVKSQLEMQNEPLYSNVEAGENPLTENQLLLPLAQAPRSAILAQCKRTSQFDIDNPWQYWKTIVALFAVLVIYIVADSLLINHQLHQTEQSVVELVQSTSQIQNRRAKAIEQQKVLEQYHKARKRQQVIARIMNELALKLSDDVVIERFSYQNRKILLQGSIEDSLGLLESISGIDEIANARLLGEVTQTDQGRQEFRAELTLKENEL